MQKDLITSEISELVPTMQEVRLASDATSVGAENIQNPFDNVGVQHNIKLAEILQKYPHGISSENFNEQTYIEYFRDDDEISPELLKRLQKEITLNNYRLDFPSVMGSIEDKLTRECVSRFFKETREGNFADLGEFTFYVKTVEDRVQESPRLKAEDKELILSVTSIYRHSAQFWNTKLGECDFHLFGKSWKQWLVVAGCDAVGGIIGGLIGSSCPGVGTALGAMRGSFLGSATALCVMEIADYEEYEPVF